MSTSHIEIEDLISRIAMGDRTAFRTLYGRTSAKLFGVCLRVLDDRALAEEALQEAYAKIWTRAGQYRVNGYSPMTWLITLARNTAVDRRRARDAGGRRRTSPIDAADLIADPAPGAAQQAEARGEARALHLCMSELPPERAEMVRRAYLDGATYAELADATGTKLNTVRTWLRRSLMQLRECLSR
ncbi:RNA polymerase subunit sigma [Salipiger aestuarii]|uniref:RNA polymerase sigma-70 factor (ECF subfamily) n=2 Tax=Salipiger aestuarii TaxID=568098 RepID=A0A327YFZ2_9RHOB|nr:sigma-70 family RNA polymerase sigma factor [Salipiger aestuarii]KAA8609524.1 RNA polymerase subunit sigma [Salipiger aestuarii]KAA8610971.1 RNA polymerase subunit sigma [Salipiger aestuarii]KAB2542417.1 RNA polymerase subunit sigma [Salipiger aestuarii]RAK18745.1 RNA polymerase sigma-70 factor (ECF subfamily) [Salipiger aestuarii]